jgi:RNA polymerase sigma factor (sigma-70 family)
MKKSTGPVDEFSQAYMEYYPLLLSSLLTKIGNPDEARDICQEVFIIFLEKYETIQNKRAWLYGTLKNVVYQHYAKKKPDVDINQVFDDEGLAFVNGSRDARIMIAEAIEHVECTEEDRILLDLIAIHDYSYGSVAEILGLSRRQVEYRYGQLAKSILEYLKSRGIKDLAELL